VSTEQEIQYDILEMSRIETLTFIRHGHEELLKHNQSLKGSADNIKAMRELNDA
jgi:hypothetical protein